jgi:signal transduction histidine kinase
MTPTEPIKILLVDDEPRNLDALEAILEDPAYELLRAGDADRALKLLLEHDVAAIVLDIKMPGVSGFELARLIKGTKKFRLIPIVFLTAYLADEKDIVTGYDVGAVDYLTKPVNPVILRQKVAVFAELFRKSRALALLNEELEARVRERTAELERASRAKDEFLATLGHELRTPLNAMLGWATMLKRNPDDLEKVQRGIEVIERNVKAQERLVTDLLDVSRVVSGKLRLKMTRVSLADVVLAAVDVVRPASEAKGMQLVLDIDPELVTVGDSGRLQQVVWNLLTNAIRYTPARGRVTVTVQRQGRYDVVRIEDTGIGIAAEHLPYVFDRFRQVDSSTTRAHGGLGLGLALVRHLVEAHGGFVDVHSDGLGRGSVFTLSLPVRAVDAADAEAPEGEFDATAEAALGEAPSSSSAEAESARLASSSRLRRVELAGVHVLIVDDDPDSLDLVRIVLEESGAQVTAVSSAIEALQVFEAPDVFDVIVSDIAMPGMDGYAFVRHVRRRVPAVALTAYARAEDVERSLRSGYQAHLSKPVDSRKLVEVVKSLVGAPGRVRLMP